MPDPQPKPPASGIRRAALADLLRLLRLIGKPRFATPTLIILGLASSFAETIGITLILFFLYAVTGHAAATGNGMLGGIVTRAAGWFGGTVTLAWLILGLIVARGAIASLYGRISANIAADMSERARNLVHQQYLEVAYSFIQHRPQSNLMEVLATEAPVIAGAYLSFTRLIINACSIAVFALFLAIVSWQITIVAIIGSLVISAISRRFTGRARALGHKVKDIHEQLGLQMLVTIQGMRTLRAYGQEAARQRVFATASAEAKQTSNALVRLSAWIGPITEAGYLAILCVIIAGTGWWHTSFPITLAAVALLYRLQPHTREFEDHLMNLAQVQPQLRSVRSMLERAGKPYPRPGHLPFTPISNDITFHNVGLRYQPGAAPALDGVSLRIPAGATTALIGASGAGKTTIVNLLLRLYEPDSGHITVDGTPLNDIRRDEWVRQIGVAGQDIEIIDGSVMDNIRMADPLCTDDTAITAARIAGCASFIEPLEWGYESWVGPEGLRFSGGQRQRIGLARALLRGPQLLILDEAMSALDRGLEDRVKHEIDTRMAHRTILLITHRLETIKTVQHVIWIADGRVKAEGPPDTILPQALPTLAPAAF